MNRIADVRLIAYCLLSAAAGLSCSTAEAPPVEKVEKKEPAKESVINQLEDLFRSAPQAGGKPASAEEDTSQPYLKVINGAQGRSTIIYKCRHLKAGTIVDALETAISSSGIVEEANEQNLIVINDVSEKADELKDTVLALDVSSPQIMVEAKVIEVYFDDGMEKELKTQFLKHHQGQDIDSTYGFDLDAPSPNPLAGQGTDFNFYPYISGNADENYKRLQLFIRWLKTARDIKVLSAPNLIVDLGTKATIVTGEDIPIQSSQVVAGAVSTSIEFKRIGVILNVTPELINRDSVRLNVNPEVSTVTRYVQFTQNNITFTNPTIAIRNIKTTLSVKNNEVIMLGGLYSSEEVKSSRRTPFFGDLPLFGDLFSAQYYSKVLTQLVFLLKIRVLDEGKEGGRIFFEPDRIADEMKSAGSIIEKSEKIFPRPDKEKKPDSEK